MKKFEDGALMKFLYLFLFSLRSNFFIRLMSDLKMISKSFFSSSLKMLLNQNKIMFHCVKHFFFVFANIFRNAAFFHSYENLIVFRENYLFYL